MADRFIEENFLLSADNTDVLKTPSRLASIPRMGGLLLEMSASDLTSANQGKVTLQTPDGDTPAQGVLIPYNGLETGKGILNAYTKKVYGFRVQQGGHFIVNVDVTGTVLVYLRAVLYFPGFVPSQFTPV